MTEPVTIPPSQAKGLFPKSGDPLGWHMPHTPRLGELPDSRRPTCSAPSERNKGCGLWDKCNLRTADGRLIKSANGDGYGIGPVGIILENNRNAAAGQGRRFSGWCFSKLSYLSKPGGGFTLIPPGRDHVYDDLDGDKVAPKLLKNYEDQGPYYFPVIGEQTNKRMLAAREAMISEEETPDDGDHGNEVPPDGGSRRHRNRQG